VAGAWTAWSKISSHPLSGGALGHCPRAADAVECAGGDIMAKKPTQHSWAMRTDRELIALSKTKTLEAIADQLQRPPGTILRAAKRLGLSIERKAK
jgi:hypothetical protein